MYDLFNKKIDNLVFEDLNTLIENEVTEGFYIEFKTDFQKPQDIAKSIASFANTRGGWYFIGVEDDDKTNIAKDIVGFDIKKHKQPKESIRQISRAHIHPIPYFEMKLLKSNEEKYVLIIYVPESFETPHILSNGVVYLRNGEESNPIKNSDKYTLDKLYQKNLYLETKLNTLLKNPFGMTSAERNDRNPFLNICLLPKNFNELNFEDFDEDSFLEKLMKIVNQVEFLLEEKKEINFNNDLESVTRTPHSIIFRQVPNGIRSFNQTIEFFYNGAARIKMPIPYTVVRTPLNNKDSENRYFKLLYQILGAHLSQCKLVNIGNMFFIIKSTIRKYSRFIDDNTISQANTLAMVEMKNIFQLIPFVESESFIEHIEKYHVPISMYENKKIPDELSSRRWIEFEELNDVEYTIFDIFKMGLGLSCDSEIFSDSLRLILEKHVVRVESSIK